MLSPNEGVKISHRISCRRARFWPRESRNLIGPLAAEMSTEVNCLRDSLTISIRPPSPRNKSSEVEDILVILGELSLFLSLLRMAFGLTQADSHLEQRNPATVKCTPFYRIVSPNFHLKLSASIEDNNVVAAIA